MKIACLGGGPAGLYFAISMKLRDTAHDITVFERNRPDDTFGWGVVFSDETFDNITANDPVSAAAVRAHFAYWDDIAVHYRGQRLYRAATAFPVSRARSCSCCCNSAPARLALNWFFGPKSPAPANSPKTTTWSSRRTA